MRRFFRAHSLPACSLALLAIFSLPHTSLAQSGPARRIVRPIDENEVVTLSGSVHPLARAEFDRGAIAGEQRLDRMMLQLKPSPAQQADLDALVAAQHDPHSPLFHKWLTPAQYGARFGVSQSDIATVSAWLHSHGFVVDEVPASNRLIVFSGTADQVADAFHTELHTYRIGNANHIADIQEPQIPVALANVIGGVVSLHDFRRKSQISSRRVLGSDAANSARPDYSSGATHYLFPADWATIYDLNSLYTAGKNGTGASIAIIGRSDINLSDVASFRSNAGLPANAPNVIHVNSAPGIVNGDQDESTLDVEWSGATAPGASIRFVVASSTATSDGIDLAVQYAVNHASATVMSTSYGSCEQDMGGAELSFYNSLWQQAASEGISSFVSAGDAGAAGCDGGSSTKGSMAAVNGLCSSPYSTCVGGTEFNEESHASQYWSSTNSSNYGSALSYIPEKVWNESASNGGSGLWASGGGVSTVYSQPSWQKGIAGASAGNGMRTVPDISASAAGHDGYIINENGSQLVIAGTSAASPALAGVMALVVQSKSGVGQGNANTRLYALLNASHSPFHPTVSGNNSVPSVTGFTATGTSYNLATGLGSIDGAVLLSDWGGSTTVTPTGPNFALAQSAKSGSVVLGKSITFTVAVTESGNGNTPVSLVAKVPAGVTATFAPASITPGTASTVTIAAVSTAVAGTQNITITGANSSGTQTLSYALTTVLPPTLAISYPNTSSNLAQGGTEKMTFVASAGGSYAGNITWSITGLPAGVTSSWSTNPMTPPSGTSSNNETLTLTASASAKLGASPITISAAGDGLIATKQISLQVTQAPGITLAVSLSSLAMQSLATATATVTATPLGGMTVATAAAGSSMNILAGLPHGITASWSAPKVSANGTVAWTLTLTGSSAAVAGTSTIGLSAKIVSVTGASFTGAASLPLTVTLTPPALSVTSVAASMSFAQGKSAQQAVTVLVNGTYSGPVTLSVSGLPNGVTAAWSQSKLTLNGQSGTSTLTLTASSTAKTGTATITIGAAGDGLTASRPITVQVSAGAGGTSH